MTERGDPYENQVAERVNGILKDELALDQIFDCYEAALVAVRSAVERYNKIRPHSSVDNLTPDKAHGRQGPLCRRWTNRKRKQNV